MDQNKWLRRRDLGRFAIVDRAFRIPADKLFFKILEEIKEEEQKSITAEDEERLFDKIHVYLKNPLALLGIHTLQKLAYIPSTTSDERLKRIATIICKKVFNPPVVETYDFLMEYIDFCKGFAYLKASTNEGVIITFEQILISSFLHELPKKFNYAERLKNLLKNRNLPQDKKQKWLEKQIDEQERIFKIITKRSIMFLDEFSRLYPEIAYRVIEFLLQCEEEDGLKYLCTLLETASFHKYSCEEFEYANVYEMKRNCWRNDEHNEHNEKLRQLGPLLPAPTKKLAGLFENITTLSARNQRISTSEGQRQLQKILDNPYKENHPQDFIKYYIKHFFHSNELKPEDDFEIDEKGDFDCRLYILFSKHFSFSWSGNFYWNGLLVKVMLKKPEKKQVKLQKYRSAV